MEKLEDVEYIKRNIRVQLHTIFIQYQKRNFRGTLTNRKLVGISVLNAKGTVLKEN